MSPSMVISMTMISTSQSFSLMILQPMSWSTPLASATVRFVSSSVVAVPWSLRGRRRSSNEKYVECSERRASNGRAREDAACALFALAPQLVQSRVAYFLRLTVYSQGVLEELVAPIRDVGISRRVHGARRLALRGPAAGHPDGHALQKQPLYLWRPFSINDRDALDT